jgi:hypothetical protein
MGGTGKSVIRKSESIKSYSVIQKQRFTSYEFDRATHLLQEAFNSLIF